MRGVGTDIGTIHFIGIGGIGMSGIAEVMHILGYKVQGSDVAEGYVVQGLRDRGIPIEIGHKAENIGDAAVVVASEEPAGPLELDLAVVAHRAAAERAVLGAGHEHAEVDVAHRFGNIGEGLGHGASP